MKEAKNMLEVVNLLKEVEKSKKKSDKLRKKSNKLLNEAMKLCPHPETREDVDYYEGGYMDRATTTTHTYCDVCGLLLGTEIDEHSWYG